MKIIFGILSVLSLFGFSSVSSAQVTPQWASYSAISPDGNAIAFTYKGDIYVVPVGGGPANQLTFHKAHDYRAVWSPDSQHIAFASNRHGNFDVYVMSALGGKATRLTFHSSDEEPYTFSNDKSRVLFQANRMDTPEHRQLPRSRFPELYSVATTGGRVTQVMTLPVQEVQISPNGGQMVYIDNKGTENPWRKHHQSSATRDIWTYDLRTKKHTQITRFAGEDRNPVYSEDGKHIYYLSEQSGSFNVHKLAIDSAQQSEQLTEFSLHPVRFLSEAKGTLVFTYHGEIYVMQEGRTPKRIDIAIRTQDIDNSTALLPVNGEISNMAISPSGDEIAFISRGDVFVSSNDGSFTKQITETPATEASVSFSPDGDYLVYASERGGKWSIFKAEKAREQEPFFYAASLIKESVLFSNDEDNYQPLLSPDGNKLAFVENRRTIKVATLKNKRSVSVVPASETIHFRDGDQHFSWSPDSKWILFQHDKLINNADVAMVSADGSGALRELVPSGYYDLAPEWVNQGKQVMWFSNRQGLRSYATSGRSQLDVYALFLTEKEWDKFNLSEDDFALMEAIEEAQNPSDDDKNDDEKDEDKDEKSEEVVELSVDWEDLDKRIARFTIHSSDLSDAVVNKDLDTLYYLSRFEDEYDLWQTNLRTKETKKAISLGASDGSLMWDKDMENLYLLSDGTISKLDLDEGSSEGISVNAQMLVDHDAIRQSAFEHVWLRTAKIFYEPTYHGVDWQLMHKEYAPRVAHIGNPFEFAHLLSEMLGELNVSHSGAGYSGSSARSGSAVDDTAALGIFYDYDYQDDGIKITEVVANGPLDKANMNINAGDIIRKIDGKNVTNNIDWASLLNRKVNSFVLLDVYNAKTRKTSQISVKPISLGEQSDLLYERFLKINEQEVLQRSDGKLGYVHVPSMSDGPYRSIYHDMMGRFYNKDGMVIDTRFNNGGDLVGDLSMFFSGTRFLSYETADRVMGGEPTSRYTKPIVSLFNESMYSDGHCYASGYTDLNLGKSVGMPVPGTCSFAGWSRLPMGVWWGVVPISVKNKAGEWLENNQTSPDVLIRNMPGIIDAGRDQQLERGIAELMSDL